MNGSKKRRITAPRIVRVVLGGVAGLLAWYGLALRGSLGFFVNAAEKHAASHLPGDPSKLGFVGWVLHGLSTMFGDAVLVIAVLCLLLAVIPWGWRSVDGLPR